MTIFTAVLKLDPIGSHHPSSSLLPGMWPTSFKTKGTRPDFPLRARLFSMTEPFNFALRSPHVSTILGGICPLCALDVYRLQYESRADHNPTLALLSPPYACLSHEMHTGQIDIPSQTSENYSFQWVMHVVFFHKMLGKNLNKFFSQPNKRFTCG